MILNVSDNTEFQNQIQNGVCLVDFWAPWCGPCRMLSSVLEELEQAISSKINIIKVNVDDLQDLAAKYNIQSIPALLLFKDEILIDQKSGFMSKSAIEKWLTANGVTITN